MYKVGDKIFIEKYKVEVTIVEVDSNVYHCVDDNGKEYAIESDDYNDLNEVTYQPPMSLEDIRTNYPDKAEALENDPVHYFRATTGIELIHKEPTRKEQEHIWKNWNTMTNSQRKISDKKAKEIYGMTNKEMHEKCMKEWDDEELNESMIDDLMNESSVPEYIRYSKKERENMDPNDFAIPELKKFPITDEGNVNDAKTYYRYVPPKYREEASNRIFDKMVELDMPLNGSGEWTQYLSQDRREILNHKPRLTSKDIQKGEDGKWIIIKEYDKDSKYPVFIILTGNPTPAGIIIRSITDSEYNHASLSLDPSLKVMYSFTMGPKNHGGFVIEDFDLFKRMNDGKGSRYAIFTTLLSEKKYRLLQDALEDMHHSDEKYDYNYLGLINFLTIHKPKKYDKAFFCSEFVAHLLRDLDGSIINNSPNLFSPEDLRKVAKFYELENGWAGDFDDRKLMKKIEKFINSKKAIKYFSENSDIISFILSAKVPANSRLMDSKIFGKFYPCINEPFRSVTNKSFGGIFQDLMMADATGEEYSDMIEMLAMSGGNKYGVFGDINGLEYRIRLHDFVINRLISYSTSNELEVNDEEIINLWEKEVNKVRNNDKLDPRVKQQTLYELFTDPDKPFDIETKNYNLQRLDIIFMILTKPMNETFIDRSNPFSTFVADLPDELYLIPSARMYPCPTAAILQLSADKIENVEFELRTEFINNFCRLYQELGATFTLPTSHPMYTNLAFAINKPRDKFYDILIESKISKSKYNFDIDENGTILISEKEKADFEMHFKDSLRLIKIYKDSDNYDGIKNELCRIYYMTKVIEVLMLDKDMDTKTLKAHRDLRAKMLSAFALNLKYVINHDKSFDFNDYFSKSPYGDALTITVDNIKGVVTLGKLLKSIFIV